MRPGRRLPTGAPDGLYPISHPGGSGGGPGGGGRGGGSGGLGGGLGDGGLLGLGSGGGIAIGLGGGGPGGYGAAVHCPTIARVPLLPPAPPCAVPFRPVAFAPKPPAAAPKLPTGGVRASPLTTVGLLTPASYGAAIPMKSTLRFVTETCAPTHLTSPVGGSSSAAGRERSVRRRNPHGVALSS